MEIEKKYLVARQPDNLQEYPCLKIQQAYLCTNPVVRIRQQNEDYYLTYKGGGMMMREEYNLPLNRDAFQHLLKKADGHVISKTRYLIPIHGQLTAELDVFDPPFRNIILVEVEFQSEEQANTFTPPDWFGLEVTYDKRYHNSYLSNLNLE